MSKKILMEDKILELERNTALLGFVHTAFADGKVKIDIVKAADAVYELWIRQKDILSDMKEIFYKEKEGNANE